MRAAVQSSSNFFHNVELLRNVYCSGRVAGNHDERRADGMERTDDSFLRDFLPVSTVFSYLSPYSYRYLYIPPSKSFTHIHLSLGFVCNASDRLHMGVLLSRWNSARSNTISRLLRQLSMHRYVGSKSISRTSTYAHDRVERNPRGEHCNLDINNIWHAAP